MNLHEAARPLADYADRIGGLFPDTCVICTNPGATAGPGDITVGDLRRLREALQAEPEAVEERGRLTERAQEALRYGRKNFDAALGFQDRAIRAETERDQLRLEALRAIEDASTARNQLKQIEFSYEDYRKVLAERDAAVMQVSELSRELGRRDGREASL